MRQCIDVAILILMLRPTGGLIAVDAYEQLLLYMHSIYSPCISMLSDLFYCQLKSALLPEAIHYILEIIFSLLSPLNTP